MRGTYSFGKRLLAMLLCVAMVAAYLPGMALPAKAAITSDADKIVDLSTMDDWKELFGPGVLSTEFAGGVWTDKSVFKSFNDYLTAAGISGLQGPTTAISGEVREMLNTDPESFLIALSAIAANQEISGYTTTPSDTMLVLDVSQSMDNQGYVPGMITAANDTIRTLMDGNQHNRVGVVLFSGSNNQQSNQGTTSATVLLPLDHYTATNADETFLRYTGNASNTSVYIAAGVKNSAGTTMNSNTGKTTNGGTYTQNGLYKAWGEFSKLTAADTVIPEGKPQAGTKRIPAVVLMSDGQPTVGDTTYYDIGNSTIGDGTTPSQTNGDRMSFLTQLTAAWMKAKIANKYGIENQEVRFYTVGLNTQNNRYATDTLNPAASTNTTVSGYWNDFIAATPNRQGQITIGGNYFNNGWTIYKSTDGMITSADQRVYTTQYFPASNTDKLAEAFKKIADDLTVGAPYVTLVTGDEADLDGYITFEDKLGALMEVKDIKGLAIADRIFTGAELAKGFTEENMGTVDEPKAYGDEFIRTIKERLGITDTAVAQQLAINAYGAGQLSYTSATEFSNYIGWYADADGNYKGFWQESDGYGIESAPEGTAYINKSYGFLGAASTEEGASDMMHVVVMVHTNIYTGDQTIIYKIPASLIPTVLYKVEVDGTDMSNPTSITREEAFPLQLLVEVGLRSDINEVNIDQKVAQYEEAVEAYAQLGGEDAGHIHKHADGTYTFYTNKWGDGDGGEVNYNEPLTHHATESHFHPANDNGRYYFTEESLIYRDENGTVYTGGTAPTGTGYFYARSHYEKVGNGVEVVTEYLPVAAVTITKAVAGENGQWYIPAGTPYQETERFNAFKGGDANNDGKADANLTETLEYSNHPLVLHNEAGYNTYALLGNNGTFDVKPAQGIALTKTVSEQSDDPNAPAEFTFVVTLSQAVSEPVITDLDGKELTGISSVSGNKITVKLTAGQTVVITGIPTGVTYTVEEEQTRYYTASSQNATGTVAAYTIHPVDFTNAPKGYGDLIVSKDVTHPFVTVPEALTNKQFTIHVSLSGEDVAGKTFQTTGLSGVTEITTDNSGTFTVQLRDGESITVLDLPEGTTYTTTETLSASADKGFAMDTANSVLTGTIVKNTAARALVINQYAPAAPATNITVSGTKTVDDAAGAFDWTGKSFQFKLEQYHPETGHYTQVGQIVSVTQQGGTYAFTDELEFTQLGTYYYKVSEVIPAENDRLDGMSYDATTGRFVVYVTDNNVDGQMELEIRDYTTNQPIDDTNGTIIFTKNFVNTHSTDATYVEFTVDKTITDPHNIGISEAGYLFGLYEVVNGTVATEPTYTMRTTLVGDTTDGKATFHIPLTKVGSTTYILKEIPPVERQQIPGMTYDPSEYTVVVSATAEGGKLVPSVTFTKGGQTVTEQEIVFNNVVRLNTTSQQWSVEKDIAGLIPVTAEQFTFTLTETDGSFVTAKAGGVTDTVTITGEGTNTFKSITYTAVGTHYYVIRETAGNRGGMTYDATVYHVTVNVTVNGDDLAASTTISKLGGGIADKILFTNTYAITETEDVQIGGLKELIGREQLAGEFEFGLYEGTNTEPVRTAKNLTNGHFTFPVITYSAADIGTHTYTIKEIPHRNAQNGVYQGITYSTQTYTVTVVVSDDGNGGLNVTKTIRNAGGTTIDADDVVITNIYDPADTSVTLNGSKSWYDQNAEEYLIVPADKFTFELYESDASFATIGNKLQTGNTAGSANNKAGSFSFKLDYEKAGDYYYILREQLGSDKGVSYDTTRYFIRVLVSDDGIGGLHPTVTMTKSGGDAATQITFSNYYKPAKTTATIQGEKVLTGRDNVPVAEGEFSFELYEGGELLETVSNAADRSFTFSAIEYEKSGTYTYTVKEHIPTGHVNNVYKGVTYDTNSYTVTVVVTDNKQTGELEANVTYPAGGLKVTNTYEGKATSFDLPGTKKIEGARTELLEGETYTFYLYDYQNNHVATAISDAQGNFVFRNIPLNKAKDYVFTVKEAAPAGGVANGVHYSLQEYKVTLTVTDNGAGDLIPGTPVITLNNQPQTQMVFINTYAVAPTTATIRAIKKLEGKTLTGGMFSFELYENGVWKETVTNKTDGAINFSAIEYTQAGIYEYTIKEVIPTGAVNNVYQGITYDPTVHEVTVEVVDNNDGTLTATPIYDGGSVQFTNRYDITGSVKVDIFGTKNLTGKNLEDGIFTFHLFDENGVEIGNGVQNDGQSFIFEDVELTEAKTYRFTIAEEIPNGAVNTVFEGIDYDERVYTAYVTARDNGVGGLTASAVTYSVGGVDTTKMEFVNRYSVSSTTLTLDGQKFLDGRDLNDGEFFFDVFEGTTKVAQGTNDGNTIEFEAITYTQKGSHTYTIKERIPAEAVNNVYKGVTYDTDVFTVTVEVVDNGDGTLTATPTYTTGAVKFENTYATATAYVDFVGTKELEGKDIAQNPFTFELYDEAGQFVTNATTDAEGDFVFENVELAEAKNYTFTVKEQIPTEAVETVLNGMDYDERVYKVTVEVTDNGDGTLKVADPVYWLNDAPADMQFKNVYSVTGTTHVDISGEKKLTGKPMVAGDFTFELYKGEELVAYVTNTVEGDFLFDDVTLTQLGENVFTVVEKNTGVAGMDYDEREYTVKVMVDDNGVGGLQAQSPQITLEGESAEILFENTYKPADITVDLGVEKTVQSLTEQTIGPEGFKFLLADENGKELQTVESDKEGKAKFSLKFQAEDVGKTFKGTVSEVNTKKTGVTYSQSKYAVEITITQADSGELIPQIKLDGKQTENVTVKFVNVYEPPVSPITGDDFSVITFFTMMVLSSFGIAAVVICKKKEEEKKTT